MSRVVSNVHVFKVRSWEPVVENLEGELIYRMPVANGHFDKSFSFAISDAHFDVLKADEERRYFLYAALHAIYQPRPMTSDVSQDRHFDLILLADKPNVERTLNLQDAQSNRAVSNLVAILMKRDQAPMIAGRWFQTDDPD